MNNKKKTVKTKATKESENTQIEKQEEDDSHQKSLIVLFKEFKNESDRAAVILSISLIDEALEILLKKYFVSIPSSDDNLFDNPMSAFSSFSAKIDVTYRLGLISAKFCRHLHEVKKIRNMFAHNIYGCNFDEGKVTQKIQIIRQEITGTTSKPNSSTREKFLEVSSVLLFKLNDSIKNTRSLSAEKDEWIYSDSSQE